jgi:hypothetical protein
MPADVTLSALFELDPQELFDFTEIVPPLDPGVTSMEVELEFPVQPDGKLHVYELAPDTDAI